MCVFYYFLIAIIIVFKIRGVVIMSRPFSSKPKWFAYTIGVILLFISGLLSVFPLDMVLATDNYNWLLIYILDAIVIVFSSRYWTMLVKESHNDI